MRKKIIIWEVVDQGWKIAYRYTRSRPSSSWIQSWLGDLLSIKRSQVGISESRTFYSLGISKQRRSRKYDISPRFTKVHSIEIYTVIIGRHVIWSVSSFLHLHYFCRDDSTCKRRLLSYADNQCKQFGPRSKPFDTLIVLLNSLNYKVSRRYQNHEILISRTENPASIQSRADSGPILRAYLEATACLNARKCWCDFQQCGILTSVDSDAPVQLPFKLRNSKWCSVIHLTLIEYSSDKQRFRSDCAYAQADLRLCWSHIPHCWKSHTTAHISFRVI